MNQRAAANFEDLPYLLIVSSLIGLIFGWLLGTQWPSAHVSFLTMLAMQASAQFLRFCVGRRHNPAHDAPAPTTSIAYYRFIVRQHDRVGVVLVLGTSALYVTIVTTAPAESSHLAWLATLPLVVFALAIIRVWILRQRVLDGRFATDQPETQELIDFIVMHSEDAGSGRRGTLRRVLLPLKLRRVEPSAAATENVARG